MNACLYRLRLRGDRIRLQADDVHQRDDFNSCRTWDDTGRLEQLLVQFGFKTLGCQHCPGPQRPSVTAGRNWVLEYYASSGATLPSALESSSRNLVPLAHNSAVLPADTPD